MRIGSDETRVVLAPGQEAAERTAAADGAGKDAGQDRPALALEGTGTLQAQDQRTLRRKVRAIGAVLVAVSLLSLCVDDSLKCLYNPLEMLACYKLWFSQTFAVLTHSGTALSSAQILATHPAYYRIVDRVAVTFLTVVAGMILALAGALYQHAFRNPIASPTMLGVSSGLRLGYVLLVLIYGTAASEMTGACYLFCYGSVIVTLLLLLVFTKLIAGRGRPVNIVDMLLVATILSQLIGVIVTYVTWYLFDDTEWEVYNSLSEVLTVDTHWYAFVALGISCLVAIVPIYLYRFRLNVLSFEDSDMKLMGVDPSQLRVLALVCGTVLVMTAQLQTGTVAMVSLVVPHVSRFVFGAEFRKQFFGNLLLGAVLLVVCRCIVSFIPFVGGGLPIGTVVNFVVLPAFVWMIATQQRSWE